MKTPGPCNNGTPSPSCKPTAMPSAKVCATTLAGINVSAGSTSNNMSSITFANDGGVSFGLSGSIVTASAPAAAAAPVNFSAGSTSNNLGSVVFSNSNGVTFGLNGSTVTASIGTIGAGGVGISAAGASASAGTVVFSNSNNVTFGMAGSTVTASASVATSLTAVLISGGTTSNLLSALTFADSNGVSFGLNASVLTATVRTDYMSSNVATISNLRLSAGTTSNLLSAVTFSNSNGVSFGLNASTVTASVATSLTAVNVSGGTTSNNLSAITFSNSNGVSFGLNASVMTASHNALTTAMASNRGTDFVQATAAFAGTNASGTINSTGISVSVGAGAAQTNQTLGLFASSNTTLTSSGTADARSFTHRGIGGISVGVSASEIIFSVRSDYLTTAMQSNAVTLSNIRVSAGTTSNLLSDVTFSNSNGISFGLNASTVTASHNALTTQTNQQMTMFATGNTTQSSTGTTNASSLIFRGAGAVSVGVTAGSVVISGDTAAAAPVNVSAGTTSNLLDAVVFSNSNGISFGLDGSTVTASHNALTSQSNQAASAANGSFAFQTVSFSNVNGVSFGTTAGSAITASIATSLTNIRVSGGTTSNLLSAITWADSNGISFGLNASTMTATVKTDYLTTAMLSNAATISNIRVSAGTTSNLLSAVTFSNSNGVSFGLNASTVTASVATSLTNINVSAGTTSNLLSALTFSNSNGVSFGLNGSTLTASVAAGGAGLSGGFSTMGNTSGDTGLVTGQLNLAGGDNVTLSGSTNAGSISVTISAAGSAVPPVISHWINLCIPGIGSGTAAMTSLGSSNATLIVFPLSPGNDIFPGNMTAESVLFNMSGNGNSSSHTYTLSFGLYTQANASQISLINSGSTSWGFAGGANNSLSYIGQRWLSMGSSQFASSLTLSNKSYWGAVWMRLSQADQTIGHMIVRNFNTEARSGFINAGSVANKTLVNFPFFGIYSVSFTTAMPTALHRSDMSAGGGGYAGAAIPHIVFNNYGGLYG